MTNNNETQIDQPSEMTDLVAVADNWYRGKMLIVALVLIGYCGGYFLYDGFIGYPNRNAQIDELNKKIDATTVESEKTNLTTEMMALGNRKSAMDMLFQKVIGFVSVPVGLWVLFSSLHKSRGEIRLSGKTLHAPGHPPLPLDAITSVDDRRWDKKGIAIIHYELPDKTGRIRMDDFIYQRAAIDRMHDQIIAYVAPAEDAE